MFHHIRLVSHSLLLLSISLLSFSSMVFVVSFAPTLFTASCLATTYLAEASGMNVNVVFSVEQQNMLDAALQGNHLTQRHQSKAFKRTDIDEAWLTGFKASCSRSVTEEQQQGSVCPPPPQRRWRFGDVSCWSAVLQSCATFFRRPGWTHESLLSTGETPSLISALLVTRW